MKITTLEVAGLEPALKGMRNPMNSWSKSDSEYVKLTDRYKIGKYDMRLATSLKKAGTEHGKYLRMIQVWADFDMPLYWWSEFDTYKFNTKNSCSTMHKLFNAKKGIELSDFVFSEEEKPALTFIISQLNSLREKYLQTKDVNYLVRGKRLLPSSFKQKRTVNTNYAELMNIYSQRKNHRLKEEWQEVFCKWCESLPYFTEFIEAKGK